MKSHLIFFWCRLVCHYRLAQTEVSDSETLSSALICVRILQSRCCCAHSHISGHRFGRRAAGRQVWACLCNTASWALSLLYRSYILIHYLTQLESKSFRRPVQRSVWIGTRCLYLSQGCQSELHHCLVYSPVHKKSTLESYVCALLHSWTNSMCRKCLYDYRR